MNKLLAALSLLALAACAAPAADAASSSAAADSLADRPALRVDATWGRVITGTPTLGFDGTTPAVRIALRVDDASVRADHPGFDGLERPFALIPKADGSSQRVELEYEGTSQEGFIELHPVDLYASDSIYLTEADLPVVQAAGVTVALDTNVGVIGGDKSPVVANNP